jgi:PAS domain S-box-containing protein
MLNNFRSLRVLISTALTLVAGIFAALSSLDACAEQKLPILAGSEYDYPPFCVVTKDGRADGFSVELMRAALNAVGDDVEFKVDAWNVLKKDLEEGRIDALPLVARNAERAKVFDFTPPYFSLRGAIFVRKDDARIKVPGDLRDKSVAVMKSDTGEEYVNGWHLSNNVVVTETLEQAFTQLSAGQFDAVVASKLVGENLIATLKLDNISVAGPPLEKFQEFCFAVRKGNAQLLANLNEGLSIVIADGTHQRLREKWMVPTPEENLMLTRKLAAAALGSLLFAGLVAYIWTRTLRGKVGTATRNLEQEIELRNRAEVELKESEALFHSYFDLAQVGMCITSLDQKWLHVNARLREILGYAHEELIAMTWTELTHPDDLESDLMQFRRMVAGEIDRYAMDKRFIAKSGRIVFTHLTVTCKRGKGGTIEYIIASLEDISERKHAELIAMQFKSAIDTTHDGFWIVNQDGHLVEVNDSYAAMTGYSVAELTGMHIGSVEVVEKTADEVREHMARIVSRGWDVFETRHRCKDGREIDVEVSTTYLEESKQIVCFLRDITARKEMESALEASANEFRLLAEAMPQIVWITRADGWNIYFNRQWCDYTGLTLEESYGAGWNKPFHPDDQQRAWDAWQKAVTNVDTYALECRLRRADGEYFWWLIRGVPVLGEDGKIEKWFGTCTDIHHIKLSDEKLRESLGELEFANRQIADDRAKLEERVAERTASLRTANADLENFSYSVSHDLRAPLRAIDGFISILQEEHAGGLSEDGRRMFGIVAENARKMGHLIDDILAFSRAGRLELEVVLVDMEALVREVWVGLTDRIGERQLELRLEYVPPLTCDPRAIRQVWQNLLGNAIKFTRDRKLAVVEVSARDEGDCIRYQVMDNGVGFKVEYTDKLFVLFQRLHGMDEFEGTGVGLAIVKRFVEKHGGKVSAVGVKDQGAKFSFTLPKR